MSRILLPSALDTPHQVAPAISRRRFLQGAAALAGSSLPLIGMGQPAEEGPRVFRPGEAPATAAAPAAANQQGLQLESIAQSFWQRPRELWLYRSDTKEQLRAVYWRDGQVHADGYWRICAMLRDRRQNIMTTIDLGLLDILRGVSGYYEQWNWPYPIVVNSGFRTKKTNDGLEGAARNSMHLYGRAADIYVPGIPIADLTRLAMYFQRGGVGFYPGSGFVHVDTGRVRSWSGKGAR
jgi:uncharacterized protein YcbK (DUF882 family)